jgi:hypothetical protein
MLLDTALKAGHQGPNWRAGGVLPSEMRGRVMGQTLCCCNRSWVCKVSDQPMILGMAASISR